ISASAVSNLVKPMIAADKARGLTTRLIDISDSTTLNDAGGKPVTSSGNVRQTKAAIDAIYRHLTPDYLLILGAPDVVCHQALDNTTIDDGDADVPSDLPYACDHAYSRDVRDFLSPTRVVGRLPDLPGASNATFLKALLKVAANYKSRA